MRNTYKNYFKELKKLLKQSFELTVRTRWLKTIDKEVDKRNKLKIKLDTSQYIIDELIKEAIAENDWFAKRNLEAKKTELIDELKAQNKYRVYMNDVTYKKETVKSFDTYISELGLVQYYKYSATYNYMLNINLGLVPRPEADLGISKDLDSAKVIINNNLTNYKFNKLDLQFDNIFLPISTINDLRRKAIEKLNKLRLYNTNYKLSFHQK